MTTNEQELASYADYANAHPWFAVVLVALALWELVWKGIALWRAARNNHGIWYVFILIVNTLGILPIVYLVFFSKKKKEQIGSLQQ